MFVVSTTHTPGQQGVDCFTIFRPFLRMVVLLLVNGVHHVMYGPETTIHRLSDCECCLCRRVLRWWLPRLCTVSMPRLAMSSLRPVRVIRWVGCLGVCAGRGCPRAGAQLCGLTPFARLFASPSASPGSTGWFWLGLFVVSGRVLVGVPIVVPAVVVSIVIVSLEVNAFGVRLFLFLCCCCYGSLWYFGGGLCSDGASGFFFFFGYRGGGSARLGKLFNCHHCGTGCATIASAGTQHEGGRGMR